MGLRRSHKSTEGIGLEEVRNISQAVDKAPQLASELVETDSDHDTAKKIIAAAVGGAAIGGLLRGAYLLTQHRLSKEKEQ